MILKPTKVYRYPSKITSNCVYKCICALNDKYIRRTIRKALKGLSEHIPLKREKCSAYRCIHKTFHGKWTKWISHGRLKYLTSTEQCFVQEFDIKGFQRDPCIQKESTVNLSLTWWNNYIVVVCQVHNPFNLYFKHSALLLPIYYESCVLHFISRLLFVISLLSLNDFIFSTWVLINFNYCTNYVVISSSFWWFYFSLSLQIQIYWIKIKSIQRRELPFRFNHSLRL